MERLHKLIARSGFASRRRAEQLIAAGRVTVDGVAAHVGQMVDPEAAAVAVDGIPLPTRPDLVHYLLYKPAGVTSTVRDRHAERTVVDLVPAEPPVYPAGRLDRDSEGLLILTNDGDLTNLVTHPRYEITKTYVARVGGVPSRDAVRALTAGIELDDGPARAGAARVIGESGSEALVELVMGEGRKREVRRMLDAVGHPCLALVRVAIGPIRDRDLAPGTWRRITVGEIRSLYSAAATPWEDPVDD